MHFHGWFMTRLAIVASLLALSAGSIAGPQESGHALIIGIGQYSQDSGNPPLLGVPKDMANARNMALAMGIPAAHITELRDVSATKSNILAALDRMKKNIDVGERAFIYFSGHGTSYTTPTGCKEGLLPYTAGPITDNDVISEAELAIRTSKVGEYADKAIVMIDACFSGGLGASKSRSLLGVPSIRPKFSPGSGPSCGAGVNDRATRSFVPAIQRLGLPDQNFVQISAADYNEVSWDSDNGGLATQYMAQCLLGDAKDLNRSGAISLDEIRSCAQEKLNAWMAPHANKGMFPSTIQVRGSRNLIVVAEPPKPVVQAPIAPVVTPVVSPPAQAAQVSQPPVVSPPIALAPPPQTHTPEKPQAVETAPAKPPAPNQLATAPQALPPPSVALTPSAQLVPETPAQQLLASAATLEDIYAQRNGRLKLEVSAPKSMKIRRDQFKFSVKTNTDGYLYVVMLGSDGQSFYLLYPNKLDQNNKIKANVQYSYPRNGWSVMAGGPQGQDRVLFVVSQSPRDPKVFVPNEDSGGGNFTYSLAELTQRKRLIDFFVGTGVKGKNPQMAATIVTVEETP